MCGRKHWFLSVTPEILKWFVLGKVRTNVKCCFQINPLPQLLLILLCASVVDALSVSRPDCNSLVPPAGGDDRLFNSPAQSTDRGTTEEEKAPSELPPYSRLT